MNRSIFGFRGLRTVHGAALLRGAAGRSCGVPSLPRRQLLSMITGSRIGPMDWRGSLHERHRRSALQNTWHMLHAIRRLSSSGDPSNNNKSSSHGASGQVSWLRNPFAAMIRWFKENQQRLTLILRQYGPFAITTWFTLYFSFLFSIWGMVHAGFLQGPDVNQWLSHLPEWLRGALPHDESGDKVALPPAVSEFLTAWLLTKTTEPPRLALAVVAIPAAARVLPPWARSLFGMPAAGAAGQQGEQEVRSEESNKHKGQMNSKDPGLDQKRTTGGGEVSQGRSSAGNGGGAQAGSASNSTSPGTKASVAGQSRSDTHSGRGRQGARQIHIAATRPQARSFARSSALLAMRAAPLVVGSLTMAYTSRQMLISAGRMN